MPTVQIDRKTASPPVPPGSQVTLAASRQQLNVAQLPTPARYVYLCECCADQRPAGSVLATVEIGGCQGCRSLQLVNVYRENVR